MGKSGQKGRSSWSDGGSHYPRKSGRKAAETAEDLRKHTGYDPDYDERLDPESPYYDPDAVDS